MVEADCTGAEVAKATGAAVALVPEAGFVVGTADATGATVAAAPQANVNAANSAGIHSVLSVNMFLFPFFARSAYGYTLKNLNRPPAIIASYLLP